MILFNHSAGKWVIFAASSTKSTSLYVNIIFHYEDLLEPTLSTNYTAMASVSHKLCWAIPFLNISLQYITFLVLSCNIICCTQSFHFKSEYNPNMFQITCLIG
jgi:hypothetical protein